MIKKLLKSFTVFLVILGIFFSNMPFDALTFFIDSYQKTSGIVDKIWLVQQSHNGDVVDKFVSLRNISDKLRIHEAHASTFVAVSNYNSASIASSPVIKPAGTVDNDIMFALVMRNTAAAPTVVPTGWALLGSHINGVYQQRLYWKLAAGEGVSYTWAWAAAAKTAITIAAYRGGFDTANPIDVVSNTEYVLGTTLVRAASMNVTAPNSSLFWFGTLYSTTVRTWTKPSIPTTGWVENYDGGATTSDFSRTIDSMVWAGSGATGNMDGTVVTGGTTVKHAFAVALKPITAANPDATSFVNNTEGALTDGGRSSQQITVTGTNFGAGPSNGTTNAVKIGTYVVPNTNVTAWNNTTITFTIPAAATVYGGVGANGLIIRAAGADDTTPLSFYIYSNITSASANSGQIGSTITVSGDHFGASAGAITINTKTATVGTWGETSLSNVKIPGQEGAANITGKIQLTRSDAKTSNQYPAGNFTILAPSASGSNPGSATTGQTLTIEFSGLGIDTDTGTAPVLKLTKTGQTDITGTSYLKVIDYQTVSASFNLTGAAIGYWKLVVVNMDGQTGSFGNETATGFYISAPAPIVTGINPGFGLITENNKIINYIEGSNFQSGATVQLTHTALAPIDQLGAFTYNSGNGRLENGSFDLSGQTENLWWNVVVTQGSQSGSYGNETNSGFEIKLSKPSSPSNLSQSASQSGASVVAGEGIGGQTTVYFRMNMSGGLTNENYFPQVEIQPVGTSFVCPEDVITCSPASGFFAQHPIGFLYSGTPVQGWVNVVVSEGVSYHWQARVKNSAGVSAWAPFGGNGEGDMDIYVDNTLPEIYQNTRGDDACSGASFNIMDLAASIKWQTYDEHSGTLTPPGFGSYATAQVDYKKTTDIVWTSSATNPREGVLHQINLAGLAPNAIYLFKMKSQDYVANEKVSAECSFSTTSSRPIKTVEFFIGQKTAQNTGTRVSMPFNVYIPESPGASIDVKSAFIEIAGISSASSNKEIKVELRRNSELFANPGTIYAIDSTGTTTPFAILFDALSPVAGDGNENMRNITVGAAGYNYTLYLNGGTVLEPISVFSAKLVITYSYVL